MNNVIQFHWCINHASLLHCGNLCLAEVFREANHEWSLIVVPTQQQIQKLVSTLSNKLFLTMFHCSHCAKVVRGIVSCLFSGFNVCCGKKKLRVSLFVKFSLRFTIPVDCRAVRCVATWLLCCWYKASSLGAHQSVKSTLEKSNHTVQWTNILDLQSLLTIDRMKGHFHWRSRHQKATGSTFETWNSWICVWAKKGKIAAPDLIVFDLKHCWVYGRADTPR